MQTGLKTPYDLIFRDLKKSEAELTDANAQLKEAKNQAELYVDLMSHDINNMNQIGVASLELAVESGQMDDNTRNLVERSLAAFNSSSALIGNVKKLQQAKEQALEQSVIDVGDVLAAVAKHYQIVNPLATVSYEAATRCQVKGNELLYDVFSNLVDNAIKHSDGPADVRIGISKTDRGRPELLPGHRRGQRQRHPGRAQERHLRPLQARPDEGKRQRPGPVFSADDRRKPRRQGMGGGPGPWRLY